MRRIVEGSWIARVTTTIGVRLLAQFDGADPPVAAMEAFLAWATAYAATLEEWLKPARLSDLLTRNVLVDEE